MKILSEFKASAGAGYNDDVASLLGKVVFGQLGTVDPSALVEFARPSTSPIHELFEWDNREAGESWRKHQARNYVNHLLVKVRDADGSEYFTKAYHSLTVSVEQPEDDADSPSSVGARSYVPVNVISQTPIMAQQVIDRALSELVSWKNRYSEFKRVFGGVIAEITKIESKHRNRTQKNGIKRKAS